MTKDILYVGCDGNSNFIFSKLSSNIEPVYQYRVETTWSYMMEVSDSDMSDMHEWCLKTFDKDCQSMYNRFYFKTEADAALFLLRWV